MRLSLSDAFHSNYNFDFQFLFFLLEGVTSDNPIIYLLV